MGGRLVPERKPDPPEEQRGTVSPHGRRKSDKRRVTWNRIWLAVLTALWVWTALSLNARSNDIENIIKENTRQRVLGTQQRCELIRTLRRTLDGFSVPQRALDPYIHLDDQCQRTLLILRDGED